MTPPVHRQPLPLHRVQHTHARHAPKLACALGAWLVCACSGVPELPIGRLAVGLTSGLGDTRYRLNDAVFQLTGSAELELDSADDPGADVLERALPTGNYQLELEDGWQLLELTAERELPVAANLVSPNPLAFEVTTGNLTAVDFQFETQARTPLDDGGSLRVGIQVDGVGAPKLLITELMLNPQALADSQGEWLELYNAGSAAVELAGCNLARDEQSYTFDAAFEVPAGRYVTLANGTDPGFVPNAVYRGLTLPNSGTFTLRVSCGQQLLDTVTVDTTARANAAGHSLNLSAASFGLPASERAASWCDSTLGYGTDFGSPGAPNSNCL
jgi:hypothetical protein